MTCLVPLVAFSLSFWWMAQGSGTALLILAWLGKKGRPGYAIDERKL